MGGVGLLVFLVGVKVLGLRLVVSNKIGGSVRLEGGLSVLGVFLGRRLGWVLGLVCLV